MGRWQARVVLVIFLLSVLGMVFIVLADGITDLAIRWGWDTSSPAVFGGFVVPLVVTFSFILLSFLSLAALWRFASNDALGRRVSALEERVARIERVLGLDDSDSPFG